MSSETGVNDTNDGAFILGWLSFEPSEVVGKYVSVRDIWDEEDSVGLELLAILPSLTGDEAVPYTVSFETLFTTEPFILVPKVSGEELGINEDVVLLKFMPLSLEVIFVDTLTVSLVVPRTPTPLELTATTSEGPDATILLFVATDGVGTELALVVELKLS